jgi:hypothetical protein
VRECLSRWERLNCDLFIRSYWKDLPWLEFCLASINKYCHGFRAVIVAFPRSSEPWLRRFALPSNVQIEFCRDYRDDYLGQQATKLLADTFTDADYICHVDSDCVFCLATSPDDLMVAGRPRILKRPCELLGRHYPWRKPTERFLGWNVTDDFMQHQPFLFPRWIYSELRTHVVSVHAVDIETYVTAQPQRGFSEYNVMGAFAWARYRERFEWVDTSISPPGEPHCRWYWSWGGINDSIRAEIHGILHAADDPNGRT